MNRWSVLLGCFIGMSVATPAILMVPLGLFQSSVTAEFGWSRTEFSSVVAIAALFNAIIMPVAGFLIDRYGVRKIIGVGTVCGCASYASLSLASNYAAFIAIIAFAVTLGNLASYPAFMGLAQRWFDKRLGLALAMTSTGMGAGVAIFSYVITNTIATYGWRTAFLIVGLAALVIGVINLLLFVRDNEGPVPEAERRDETLHRVDGGESLGEALRTRDFWLFAASFTLVIFAVVACNFHLPALLSDRGASAALVASAVAMGAAGSLFGRLVTGIMLDRFSVRIVASLFFLGQAIGFLLLLDGTRWALPAGFLLGAVVGAEIDLLGYVIARRFGRTAYARIFGACFAVTLIGAMIGPLAMATIFDRTGSYDLGLLLLPLLPVLAFGFLCLARTSAREVTAPQTGRFPAPAQSEVRVHDR